MPADDFGGGILGGGLTGCGFAGIELLALVFPSAPGLLVDLVGPVCFLSINLDAAKLAPHSFRGKQAGFVCKGDVSLIYERFPDSL